MLPTVNKSMDLTDSDKQPQKIDSHMAAMHKLATYLKQPKR